MLESESSMGIVVCDDGDARPVPAADDGRLLAGDRVKLQGIGHVQLGNRVSSSLQLDLVLSPSQNWEMRNYRQIVFKKNRLGKR